MKSIDVKGTARNITGKKASREIRKAGAVPCNLYGEAKDESMTFTSAQHQEESSIYATIARWIHSKRK